MSDTIRPKADFETVQDALFILHRRHRKAAEAAGLSIFDFIADSKRMGAMKEEEETVCVLLGWTVKEFYAEDNRQILEAMTKEN
ncbi:MAG: hypothetical protein E6R04_01925 [Spirochaetes bacterium]|nr:MAG: hypothetical protein E6R04_01925 [Spirochaetota bacterium]